MNAAGKKPESNERAAIRRLFHSSRPKLTELTALRERMTAAAEGCGEALSPIASMKLTSALIDIQQMHVDQVLKDVKGSISARYLVHAWRSQIIVAFGSTILFQILESMFGGTGSALPQVSVRDLTKIEADVASKISEGILQVFLAKTFDVASISAIFDTVNWSNVEQVRDDGQGDMIVVSMRIAELADQLVVALPAAVIEDAHSKLQAKDESEVATSSDPVWTRAFEKRVLDTRVRIVAMVPGPPMNLRQVAAFEVGQLIELDAQALQQVEIALSGEPIFEGRLGQSRGRFTICLQSVPPQSKDALG